LRDTLPKKPKQNKCAIMNRDDTSGNGTHWVAWFKRGNDKFCCDSFGLPPPTELNNYLNGYMFYSTELIQPRQAVICGHLCLFVLKRISDAIITSYPIKVF